MDDFSTPGDLVGKSDNEKKNLSDDLPSETDEIRHALDVTDDRISKFVQNLKVEAANEIVGSDSFTDQLRSEVLDDSSIEFTGFTERLKIVAPEAPAYLSLTTNRSSLALALAYEIKRMPERFEFFSRTQREEETSDCIRLDDPKEYIEEAIRRLNLDVVHSLKLYPNLTIKFKVPGSLSRELSESSSKEIDYLFADRDKACMLEWRETDGNRSKIQRKEIPVSGLGSGDGHLRSEEDLIAFAKSWKAPRRRNRVTPIRLEAHKSTSTSFSESEFIRDIDEIEEEEAKDGRLVSTITLTRPTGITIRFEVRGPEARTVLKSSEAIDQYLASHPEEPCTVRWKPDVRKKNFRQRTLPIGAILNEYAELRTDSEILEIVGSGSNRQFQTPRLPRWRFGLQIDAPTPEDPRQWNLKFLFESTTDRSLLVFAEDLVGSSRPKDDVLRQGNTFLDMAFAQRLIADAVRRWPVLAKRPMASHGLQCGSKLTLAEVSEFLKNLEDQTTDDGILLRFPNPKAGVRKGRPTIQMKIAGEIQSSGTLSLDSIMEFDWQAALGDELMSLDEFRAIAEHKESLIPLRGKWIYVDPMDREAMQRILQVCQPGRATGRELLKRVLVDGEFGGIPISGVVGRERLVEIFEVLRGGKNPPALPPPRGFHGQLYPYQLQGYSWLAYMTDAGIGACLADDMGLGKTAQLLALLQRRREQGISEPVLLVCPMSLLLNWRSEGKKFTPGLAIHIHHGPNRSKRRGDLFQRVRDKAIVLTSYATLTSDSALLSGTNWSAIVLDEAQNIKNPDSQAAKAAKSIDAKFRIAMTGTPMENHVLDLWSIMDFLNPGFFGTRQAFNDRFGRTIHREKDEMATTALRRLIQPYLLRRRKSDPGILENLPKKVEYRVACSLTREQATLYESALDAARKKIDDAEGNRRHMQVLRLLQRLKHVCNHPAQFLKDGSAIEERSGKLNRLTEMIEEIHAAGERALVFTQYRQAGAIIIRRLHEILRGNATFYHGGLNKSKREYLVKEFQEHEGGPCVMVMTHKSAGVGLNLTRASHVFHFDRWWNPAVEDQASDRAHRIGQKNVVQVRKMVCVGTLEERIDELIESKRHLNEKLIGPVMGEITNLNTEELFELLRLREDAVVEE